MTAVRGIGGTVGVLGLMAFASGCGCRFGSWSTSQEYGLSSSKDSLFSGVATDSRARVFVVGEAISSDNATHWIVRRSQDSGLNWDTVDDFGTVAGTGTASAYSVVVVKDVIYVSGSLRSATDPSSRLVIRRSLDAGGTWTTVYNELLGTGQAVSRIARGLFVDSSSRIWSLSTISFSGLQGWRVMRSSDGTTWTTLASRSPESVSSTAFFAYNLFQGAAVDEYYLAVAQTVGAISTWLLLRSRDDGTTWSTLDSFQHVAGYSSEDHGGLYLPWVRRFLAWGSAETATQRFWTVRQSGDAGTTWSATDLMVSNAVRPEASAFSGDALPSGHVVIAGNATDSSNKNHWVARLSTDNGMTWSASDDFQLVASKNANALDTRFENGNLWAVGKGINTSDVVRALVRKTSCQ